MQSLTLYENEKKILDAALASGGGHIDLPTPGKAVQLRHRLYSFRKIFRERNVLTPYDNLTIPKLLPGECRVTIKTKIIEGVFVPDPQGTPAPAPVPPVDGKDDDLFAIAKQIAGDILGDD